MPEPYRVSKPKANIALEEIDRLLDVGVRFGCVLSDAGYGISAAFRQGPDARQLAWAVGIPRIQKVYPAEIEMIWPSVGRGRPRGLAIPAEDGVAAECILAGKAWQAISWRNGTKGPLSAEFAAIRVWVADGPAVRIQTKANQHLPGAEVWLAGERRASGERKYYLSNRPPGTPLRDLAAKIKAR